MAKTHHDAQALDTDQARQLYDHIRAIESLTAEKDDIQADITERKTLCCEALPINKDVLDFVIKRRKVSKGTVGNFDTMLELVEEAVQKIEQERRGAGPAPVARSGPEDPDEDEDDGCEVQQPDEPDEDGGRSGDIDDPDFVDREQREESLHYH